MTFWRLFLFLLLCIGNEIVFCQSNWNTYTFGLVSYQNHQTNSEGVSPLRQTKDIDTIAKLRYACKRFKRHDGLDRSQTSSSSSTTTTTTTIANSASTSNSTIVKVAMECLDVARQAPSGFNTQPYKAILVHSPTNKLALSKCVLGPNVHRVLDSDCTAVFLADKQMCRELQRHQEFTIATSQPNRIPTRKTLLTMRTAIILFSSGYPLPRVLAAPLSFIIRTGVALVNIFLRRFYLLPTLSSAETWAVKQTMLASMTYILSCSSKGLATIPMEGFNAALIRKQLKIPNRYAIPVIISTGLPYKEVDEKTLLENSSKRRYPVQDVIYNDSFGQSL